MTIWDFLYIIGCGVSLIMTYYGLSDSETETEQDYVNLIFSCFFCALLSWSLPIWWLGYKIYENIIQKKEKND